MRTLTQAVRALLRAPALTAVAVLSLALGVGANAAIFSLFRQVLARPLPVRDPGRLVNLAAPGPKGWKVSTNIAGSGEAAFSYPMFRDLERAVAARPAGAGALVGLAAHRALSVNLAANGRPDVGTAAFVSGSYFPVLGVAPAAGRLLGPADDAAAGAHPVAVIGHAYWAARLGADPGVVGRQVVVNGRALEVVGVAPAGFSGTTAGERPDVYVPLSMRDALVPGRGLADRTSYWVYLFGRLAPGATIADAGRELDAAYRPILRDVELPLQDRRDADYLARFAARRVAVEPGARGQSDVHLVARTPLTLLLATSGVVLLIACANVANLLLARGAGRAAEIAVRMSLGAGRRRLVVQLLAEACVLSAAGAVAGLAVARWTLAAVWRMLPADAATTFEPALDAHVLAFAGVAALLTGLAFGAFPAAQSTRPDLIARVRAGAGQIAGGARTASRFRSTLVGAQVAMSMTLLVTAALFLRSLTNLSRAELGLRADGVVTFTLAPARNGYTPERAQALFARVAAELAAQPGVTGVAMASTPLVADDYTGGPVSVGAADGRPPVQHDANSNRVSPGFFRVLGVPLVAGRDFTDADRAGAPRVAVVNETFARRFGIAGAAVGRRLAEGDGPALEVEIVGVVRDAKYATVRDSTPPVWFAPFAQVGGPTPASFYVRTALAPARLLDVARGVVRRVDPALPVADLRTMPEQVRESTYLERFVGTLAAAFAVLATVLAAVGLYGVLAYTVAQRTRELGVRVALGAARGDVRRLVLGQMGRLVTVGGGIGLAAALAVGQAARSLLYGVGAADPWAAAAAAVLLGAVALAAGYVPARRAARVDPTRALRYD